MVRANTSSSEYVVHPSFMSEEPCGVQIIPNDDELEDEYAEYGSGMTGTRLKPGLSAAASYPQANWWDNEAEWMMGLLRSK
jgi:hypothetical protein